MCFNRTRDLMADEKGQDEVWHLFDRRPAPEPELEPEESSVRMSETGERDEEPVPAHS